MKRVMKAKRGGFAIAFAVLTLVVLLTAGLGLLSLGYQSKLTSIRTASQISAKHAADAGIAAAIRQMNTLLDSTDWNKITSFPQAEKYLLPNSNANFSYSVTKKTGGKYEYVVNSLGYSGKAQKRVTATLRLMGLFEYAILTQGPMVLKNGCTIDWYNFTAQDKALQIGTLSTEAGAVECKAGVTINGDVIIGSEGDTDTVVNNKNEATITGRIFPTPTEPEFPSITVPAELTGLASQGTLSTGVSLSGLAKFDKIDLSNADILKITGPTKIYVTGDIILDNSAELQIGDPNTNASLEIFLGNSLLSRNGGMINNLTKDAKNLKIYGLDTCTRLDFRTAGTLYAAVYAPNADVRLHAKVDFYGSVVCNQFIQDVGAAMNYDALLRQANPEDIGVRFVVKRWSEQ